ncbi:hypothetical protein M8R20_00590 [Pseudomonas sp. R2.Fl]|nr:hypothetical protein [Pseudomonas sp. R2.Fl]
MIKLLIAGVWVCLVTLGSVYFSVYMATAPAAVSDEDARKAQLQLVRGETVTIPLIADGAVKGYFLGRMSFMMDKEKITGVDLPMTELMTDELFTLLVGSKMVDLGNTGAFDLEAFKTSIKDDLNKRLGDAMIEEVLVEQLDYLAKEDVRVAGDTPGTVSNEPVKIVEGTTVEEPKTAEH